jgi:hypothetical protein
VSFSAITLNVGSQRVFIVVSVYFGIDSVRKLLDTPSYVNGVEVSEAQGQVKLTLYPASFPQAE